MTKLLSAKETIRYSPTGEENGLPEHRITYSLRVPTVYDRARLRRACLARGARHWTDLEMMLVLENGVRELLKSEADAEQRGLFLADIEIYTAHVAAGDEPPSELADRIADIEAAVAWGYLPHGQSLRRHLRTSEKGDDSQRSDHPAMTIISSKDWPRCVGIGGHN